MISITSDVQLSAELSLFQYSVFSYKNNISFS